MTDNGETPGAAAELAVDISALDPRAALEAVLVNSRESLSLKRLARVSGQDAATTRRLLEELGREYDERGHCLQLKEVAGGFRVYTRPEFDPVIRRLKAVHAEHRLSPAALETLAVVAYRQPVLRADVEAIRGVDCGQTLRSLMDRNLVRIVGRQDVLGRPLLYGTSKQFLEHFGLSSLKDLPRIEELQPGAPAEAAPEAPLPAPGETPSAAPEEIPGTAPAPDAAAEAPAEPEAEPDAEPDAAGEPARD